MGRVAVEDCGHGGGWDSRDAEVRNSTAGAGFPEEVLNKKRKLLLVEEETFF